MAVAGQQRIFGARTHLITATGSDEHKQRHLRHTSTRCNMRRGQRDRAFRSRPCPAATARIRRLAAPSWTIQPRDRQDCTAVFQHAEDPVWFTQLFTDTFVMNTEFPTSRRTAVAMAATLILLLLTGCGSNPAHYTAHDVTGLMPDMHFHLIDENGQPVTASDYTDAPLNIMYFGYTNCPDVCPLTLARLGTALAGLHNDAGKRINVLFVSVDPKRDTPKHLKAYTSHFGLQFIGLTGTQARLRALTKSMDVTYSYGKPGKIGFYLVNHSAAIFVFDSDGNVRLLISQSESADEITSDLQTLLQHSA